MNPNQTIWKQVISQLKLSWRAFLLTHLIFTVLGVILFVPLIGLTTRLLLKLSGQTALADQEIAYFLLSPAGLLALVIFAALFMAILALEQAVMMRISFAALEGQTTRPLEALIYVASRAHKLWLFTARLVIHVLIIALPLLALAAFVAWYLISDYDINFYLAEKPQEFLIAVVLIGLILIALLVILTRKLIQWSMALPLILFGNTSAAASFTESAKLVQGEKQKLFTLLIFWGLLSLLAGFLTLGMIKLLGQWSIPLAAESLTFTLMLLGGLTAAWGLSSFMLTTLTSASFSGLILALYKQLIPVEETQFTAEQQPSTENFSMRLTPKSVTVIFVLIAVAASATGLWLINSIPTVNSTLVVAHRGAAGKAPENTLAAFEQAINDSTDWIELDVQENAEGTIVVMHDSDFMKLAGNPVKTWETTADTLNDIDIGSWFDPAFSSERAPTLKQVLELARGRAKVVIELKYYGHDEQLEQRVIDIIEQTDMADEIAIMSLKYAGIQKVRALRPQWKIGLLSATAIGDLSRLDTDFLAVAMGMASPGFIKRAHQAGRKVFVWTVNDRISMSRMISLGVDGIITDEPELARQVLEERADMSTVERLLIHTAQLFGEPYVPKQYRDNSP